MIRFERGRFNSDSLIYQKVEVLSIGYIKNESSWKIFYHVLKNTC